MKRGEFIKEVNHNRCWYGKQMAVVRFDGNKRISRIPLQSLELERELKPGNLQRGE